MTKIAIFTDIHGNYESLKAIMPTINKINPDYIFCAGDVIGIGPSNNEVIELLKTLPNLFIVRGNHEKYYTDGFYNLLAALEKNHHQWIKESIKKENSDFIFNLPVKHELIIEDKKITLVHYAIYEDRYTTIYNNPDCKILDEIYDQFDSDIVIFGHDHSGLIKEGKKLYINIGSLGCSNTHPGFAKFGLLTIDHGETLIDEYFIPYDITPERNKLDLYNVPDKDFIKKVFFVKKDTD